MSPTSEVTIRLATPADMEDILHGFRTYYTAHEPLSGAHKIKKMTPVEEEYYMLVARKGLSLVATNPDQGGKLVGFLTCHIYTPRFDQEVADLLAKYPPDERFITIESIFQKMDRETNLLKVYKVDKVFALFSLGVDPSMRGKSIGFRLVEKALSMAQSLGCKIASVDCTSYYSAQIAQRLGMKCIHEIAYADFVDENGEQIFKPLPIHTHLKRFVKLF